MADSHQPPRGTPGQLMLSGGRLADGRIVDVRVGHGRIEAVGTAGSLRSGQPPGGAGVVDLTGYLLLPAPAEPHAHSDTALTVGAPGPHDGTPGEVRQRTVEAALCQLGHGATALRTHVHIGGVAGLHSLEAVLQAGRTLHGLTELATVAMPQLLTGAAGAEGRAILRDAVQLGATAVGGCPDVDPDPGGYLDAVLDVAAEHGCSVDLHTEGDDPARLARIAAAATGLRPEVAVGPCAGLARLPREVAARAADRLAAAGIHVICLPQGNCGAMARRSRAAPSTATPVRLLSAAGVPVAAGSGALRDASNEVARGDPLEAAYLLASCRETAPDSAYEAVSGEARAAMGLPDVRVAAGFPAELLAVRGTELAEAVSLGYSRVVVHRGRVVARTSAVREFCDPPATAGPALPRQSQR